jgi:TPR repeat protein
MEVCQRAAQAGSTDAAVFLSTAFMRLIDSGKGDHPGVRESFVKYTEMAAKLGDNGSRYNLAKHHSKLYIEPNGEMSQESYRHLKAAERWHKLAAAEGFQPSIDSLRNIAPVLEWADERFTED